jgi:glucosylceramidase
MRGPLSLGKRAFSLLALALLFGCDYLFASDPPSSSDVKVQVFLSSADLKQSLEQQPALTFGNAPLADVVVSVDDTIRYQQMDGFGASLTDSSAWLIDRKLSQDQRNALMENLFNREKGIGLSFLRQPMGASDFALKLYSYDDVPPGHKDPHLDHFSIDHDRVYIIPLLRQALSINPQLKIMASPWSAPGWMKTSDSMVKGTLLESSYPALADYFVKFVRAYAAERIPIYAVTMQNEPHFSPKDYPGTVITAQEQSQFIRDYLGPAFQKQGLTTKIMVFDHNWDLIDYAHTVLSDPKTASFVAGTALHCYGGEATAQSELHAKFPDKDIWETECSGGEWQHGNLLKDQLQLLIGATRNWAKSVVLWNLALDQDHGPYLGGCHTCRGVVTIDTTTSPSTVSTTVDYVALGHASKFVVPGATRIESNSGTSTLENVAFQNPDGSIVLIALNSGSAVLPFTLQWGKRALQYELAAGSGATFHWNPPAGSDITRMSSRP